MGQIKKTKCLDWMRIVSLACRVTSQWSASMCRWELVRLQQRATSRKDPKIAKVYKRVKSSPVESFQKKAWMAKDSREEAFPRRSENSVAFILNWSCFKWITYVHDKGWQLPLWFLFFSSSFPKTACSTQALKCLWCFCRFSKFFLTWKILRILVFT